jgi:hypothetical protein
MMQTPPPSDLSANSQRMWRSMLARSEEKNRHRYTPTEEEQIAIVHEALLAFDRAHVPGISRAQRCEELDVYFRTQQKLGLISGYRG